MSEMAKAARAAMKEKIKRITAPTKGRVDASDYGPIPDDMHAEAKTGERPVSRRAFKSGGAVPGTNATQHAGRMPRKSGGSAMTPNNYINRDVKEANEERAGEKHVGGYASGGNVGDTVPTARMDFQPTGGSRVSKAMGLKKGGRTGKSLGGTLALGAISPAAALISALDKDKNRKAGGRVARKSGGRTNVNVIINTPKAAPDADAPIMMPPRPPLPMAPPPPPPTAGPGPGAPPPMGGMGTGSVGGGGPPVPLGRATGGRLGYYAKHGGAGSGLGRLEKIRD